jgi:hypothetical protein
MLFEPLFFIFRLFWYTIKNKNALNLDKSELDLPFDQKIAKNLCSRKKEAPGCCSHS